MQAIHDAFEGVRGVFDFVSGANDVIVVIHQDGTVTSSVVAMPTLLTAKFNRVGPLLAQKQEGHEGRGRSPA